MTTDVIERAREEAVIAMDSFRDQELGSKEYENLVVAATNLMEQLNNSDRYDKEHDAAIKQAELSDASARYKAELELQAAKYRADMELEAERVKAEAEKTVGIERAKTDRITAIVEAASDFAGTVFGVSASLAGMSLGYVGLRKVLEFEETGAITSKTFSGYVSMITKALRFK